MPSPHFVPAEEEPIDSSEDLRVVTRRRGVEQRLGGEREHPLLPDEAAGRQQLAAV
eukprot:CAMPEP_0195638114 /NCGR_PEP_ID=MMETSP0815-20121206/24816_1 /TAXON_ID=97485 /ORGANISM="Prymnesium parvum, Strain Texoma1" /LENGTH=55 /DNA_ID=CAMNT_0040780441 /DNA_START=188 /DNA_END=355 /DNA_ORIENTATION=-